MVARLQRFSTPDERARSPFENDARLQALNRLPRPDSAGGRIERDLRYGLELLRSGQPEAAAKQFRLVGENIDLLEDAGLLDPTTAPEASPRRMSSTEKQRNIQHLHAISLLRWAEQVNCLERHTATACLLPIEESGRHEITEPAERAFEAYEKLLRDDPADQAARWLYNLSAMTLGRYPDDVAPAWLIPEQRFQSTGSLRRFTDTAMVSGSDVTGLAGGVVADDLDGDGHLDLLVSSWGVQNPLHVLLNRGDGSFVEKTDTGLDGLTGGLNLTHADYDNDGDVDVLVLRGAWMGPLGRQPNSLLRNRGDGSFDDVTESAGLLSFQPTQTAAWADVDRDGHLDLFVGNESTAQRPHSSELYRSNGDGTFREIARSSGVSVDGFVKGASWGDVDGDGFPDLYVSVMGGDNRLFLNLGQENAEAGWSFEDVTENAGVGQPFNGFPAWFFDFDNDGRDDLFAASYASSFLAPITEQLVADYLELEVGSTPRLYRNQGDGTFADVTAQAGLDKVLMAMGSNFGDLDNDGYLDVYVGTGAPNFMALAPNRMFRNREGQVFEDVTTVGGFGHLQKGHGVAFADFDGDGDQDVYAVMGGAYSGDVYRNALFENPGSDGAWITLKLEGTTANRSAIGARIRVTTDTPDGPRTFRATVSTGGSFGSASLQQEMGLGRSLTIESIEVDWPSPTRTQRYEGVDTGTAYVLIEGESALRRVPR